MQRSNFALLLVLGAAAACADGGTPVAPATAPRAPEGPAATIFDGAHAGAGYDSKFFFLPPMVKNPRDDKKGSDGTLSPIVEVCELTAANVCGRLIDRYGPTGGSKTNENVRWLGNHYHVNFHAGSYTLDVTKRLRVTVFVNGLTMGWADVLVASSSKEFRGVAEDEFVTITTSQTLAIKFRIGDGIAGRITLTPPVQTVFKGQTAQYAAAVTDLHGQPLGVPITWTSSDPTIATVDANGKVTTYRTGTVTITAGAERVSATATLIVKPLVVRVDVTSVTMGVGGTRTMVANAYDAAGTLVTGEPVTWSIRAADGSIVELTSTSGASVVVTGLGVGVAVATASVADVAGTGTATVTTNVELSTICTGDGLLYFGSTTILPTGTCGIRLTPAEMWTAGSAWSSSKQPVAGGFEARFAMRMGNPGPADLLVQGNTAPGADGIVFVIQNASQNAIGGQGIGLGYQGMTSSVAVEFDTWLNPGEGDPSGNHVSIHTGGTGANNAAESYSIGLAEIAGDLYDNQVHQVVIRYVPGTITVSLDGVVILTAPLRLTNVGGSSILDAEGKAWAGFTSATGGAYGTHDILSWSMTTPAP
ncbi:MAG TPA: Ig-like domain-containing protein [Longimicrobium sp.]|jgi:hypothetical protein|nr:Ig-like domain-containing protein [Longimicrobium sp.]